MESGNSFTDSGRKLKKRIRNMTKIAKKIVIVGGGSHNWGPRLISDMLHEPILDGSEVVLLDPDQQAAGEVLAAAQKMNDFCGSDFIFSATDSEDNAFNQADFIIITISTGGLQMMAHDLKIPEKYGILQTVGDTVGPGGWNRSLRNIPVFAAMAHKIKKLAPQAAVLNYTNPMASLTGVFTQVTPALKTIGLCHGIFGTSKALETIFDVDEKEISMCYGGVNHFFWVSDFTVSGQPGYPLLAEKLKDTSFDELLGNLTDTAGMDSSSYKLFDDLYREFGMLTYCADRHTCEFFKSYLTNGQKKLDEFKLEITTIKDREKKLQNARERTLKLASGELEPFPRSRETAVDIMKSLITGTPFIDVGNLPNNGQINNLPHGAIVETMCKVNVSGFQPLPMGKLPQQVQPLMEIHCNIQLMTLEAGLTGNRELALKALSMDPLCSKLDEQDCRAMGNELLEATKEYLPQF
jgi:galacturan 1,4-alpha-galacturonidase